MGAYFLFVSPAKRQYLNPSRFGEAIRAASLLHGDHGLALALLVCDMSEARLGYDALAGTWWGDAVYAASDEAPPGLHGLATATPNDPQRNLNGLARDEYEDLGYPALAMLCEDEWTAGEPRPVIENLVLRQQLTILTRPTRQRHPAWRVVLRSDLWPMSTSCRWRIRGFVQERYRSGAKPLVPRMPPPQRAPRRSRFQPPAAAGAVGRPGGVWGSPSFALRRTPGTHPAQRAVSSAAVNE